MEDINIKLTYEEYQIFRRALESHYYLSKDEGNKEYMMAIDKLETKLIKALI